MAGTRLLWPRGDQAEADLDFGIVDQLARAAGGAIPAAALTDEAGSAVSSSAAGARLPPLSSPRNFRANVSSAGAGVKCPISSARAGSGNRRSCATSSSENTSLVAPGAPSPEEQTPMENTQPARTRTRSQTRQSSHDPAPVTWP